MELTDLPSGRKARQPRSSSDAEGLGDQTAVLGAVVCCLVGAWVVLGNVHQNHHSDSLLPVLVSLYKWTPFYWEQDRYGMLLPLIAGPIKSPFLNLLVQCWLSASATLIGLMLLSRYVLRRRHWPAVTALASGLFLALDPPGFKFEVLIGQPYGLSLGLAMAGLWIAEPRSIRWNSAGVLVGQALLILAHWVNFSAFVFLISLSILRIVRDARGGPFSSAENRLSRLRRSGAGMKDLAMISVGATVGLIAMAQSSEHWTTVGGIPFSEWPRAWTALMRNALTVMSPGQGLWVRGLLLLGAGCGLLIPARTKRVSDDLSVALGLLLVGATVVLITGTRDWVRYNDFNFRYLILALLAWQIALATLFLAPIVGLVGTRRSPVYAVGTVGIAAAVLLGFGKPSPSEVRRDLDRLFGVRTDDVLAAGCTHAAGNYWTVWTTVFHTNLVLFEQGTDRVVWGISHRSRPTRELWSAVEEDGIRVGVPKGDKEANRYLEQYGFPLMTTVEERGTITVLRSCAAVESERGRAAPSD